MKSFICMLRTIDKIFSDGIDIIFVGSSIFVLKLL